MINASFVGGVWDQHKMVMREAARSWQVPVLPEMPAVMTVHPDDPVSIRCEVQRYERVFHHRGTAIYVWEQLL